MKEEIRNLGYINISIEFELRVLEFKIYYKSKTELRLVYTKSLR